MDYFENLKQKANEGDAESQYVYACHLSNRNRSQEALAYFKMAADQVYPPAQAEITWMKAAANYKSHFLGTERDGDPAARRMLAEIYLHGQYAQYTTSPNPRLGVKYLKLAAAQKDKKSMLALSEIYRDGAFGEKQDFDRTIQLLRELIEMDYLPAKVDMGTLYYFGLGMERNPRKAFEAFSENLSKDYPISYYYLGCCYDFGMGVEADKQKAFSLYMVAAKAGVAEAQTSVGLSYYWADVVRKNLKKDVLLAFARSRRQ